MTRNLISSACLVLVLASSGWSQPKPAAGPADKPVITLVLPNTQDLYQDIELLFDLAGDPKGYKTLKETIDVFLDGVQLNKPGGVRVYANANGLRYVLSLPVANAADFKKFLQNLWDLDVKTAPPPTPALIAQVPAKVRTGLAALKLGKDERQIFGLYDGFLNYESAAGTVHIGELLPDALIAKGGLPGNLVKGADIGILIDGETKTPEERRTAFEKAKKEVLAALKKGENEDEADFNLRKAFTEHQIAEVERFFSESSKIQMGWTTDNALKHARIDIELSGVKETDLAKSIAMLGETQDDFAGVSKEGAVLSGSINFPIDPLRKQGLESIAKQARERLKVKISEKKDRDATQKQIDQDLVDLVFDIIDDIAAQGLYNGFLRTWANSDGSLTTVGATKVPNGQKFVQLLQKFATREGQNSVQLNLEVNGDVTIHRLVAENTAKNYPEVISKDGSVYVATAAGAVWYATGEKSLERLKQAIEDARTAGPKPSAAADIQVTLLPLVEVWDKIRTRSKAAEQAGDKDKAGDKDGKAAKARGMLADLELRKLALEAFKQGKDTVSISLAREEEVAKLRVQFDEGLLRWVGKALSKFVKDNLGED